MLGASAVLLVSHVALGDVEYIHNNFFTSQIISIGFTRCKNLEIKCLYRLTKATFWFVVN